MAFHAAARSRAFGRLVTSFSSSNAPRVASSFLQHVQTPALARDISKLSMIIPAKTQASFTQIVRPPQQRSVFGGDTTINLLAHLEETAKKNPNSPTAQNAFYQALLRANMPAIVVERYNTGTYASNAATDALFQKASGILPRENANNGGMSNQNSAIAQAVGAQSAGKNMATTVATKAGGAAGKDGVIHVVVDESFGSKIFKWVKMLLWYSATLYISMVILAMIIEMFNGVQKGLGQKKGSDNEAKAEHQTVRFDDVHGCDEAKDELQELVEFLKDPTKFSTLGGKLPKGVLLTGPPGTGKTLLARAVAGESGVPFFFMSGSEFDEMFVGVGAKRVRDLFAAAKGKSPAIIFIDELDAIGGKRNPRDAAYAKQTLNQLLTELDGFEQNTGIVIIAATNFPDMLDKALTRPGRFDRNIVVGLPDIRGRMAILKHHIKKIIVGTDISLETLAAGTPGFSGAELENVINQAAIHASRAKSAAVSMLDMEWAKDKVMMGAEKKSMIISQKEREMTAYHEAGHALVIMYTEGSDKLHKVTIMPRGHALGLTHYLPEMDKYSRSFSEYKRSVDISMGGKVAEELIYGPENVTSGCSSDLSNATRVAYAMVTQMGMSQALGNVDLVSNYDNLSSPTKQLIESEVRRMIEEGRERVEKLLIAKNKELHLLAKALTDYETLDRDECYKVVQGEKLPNRIVVPSGNIKVPATPLQLPEIPGTPSKGGPTGKDGGVTTARNAE